MVEDPGRAPVSPPHRLRRVLEVLEHQHPAPAPAAGQVGGPGPRRDLGPQLGRLDQRKVGHGTASRRAATMAPPRFPSSVIGGAQLRTVPRDSKGPARERTGPVGNDPREAKPSHAPLGCHTASGIAPDNVPQAQQASPEFATLSGEAHPLIELGERKTDSFWPTHAPLGCHTASGIAPDNVPQAQQASPEFATLSGEAHPLIELGERKTDSFWPKYG